MPGDDRPTTPLARSPASPSPVDPGPYGAPGTPGFHRAIGVRAAIVLYVSSVLGSGILVLPGLAAHLAGPASLLAWGFLAVASLPLALLFSSLSARRPEAGGVYAFAKEAFGPVAALTTGWLFAFWQVTGAPAVALIAASYLDYAFALGRPETYALAFGIVFAAFAVNYRGITLSNRVQLAVIAAIVGLLAVAIVVSVPRVHAAEFRPFFPDGYLPVGTAAALIFWSFLGYENVSNVAEEFRDPGRDFRRAVYWSVGIVGALYCAVAAVTVGTGAYLSGGSVAPFAALLGGVFGRYAAGATAILAVVIVFAVVNAYTTGMSRVTYATARDGGFPRSMGRLDPRTRAPNRALATLIGSEGVVLVAYYFTGVSLTLALLVASGAAIVVYVIGAAAGIRLFSRDGRPGTAGVGLGVFALIISLAVLPFVGWPVVAPLAVVGVAGGFFAVRARRGAVRSAGGDSQRNP